LGNKKTGFFRIIIFRLIFFLFGFIIFFAFCSEAKEVNPYDKYWEVAIKYQKQNRYKEADQVFTYGIYKYPKAIKLYYFRAKLRQHYLGDYYKAILDYNVVIKLNPNYNPKAFWRRGVCFDRIGSTEAAIKDFTNCLRLMPRYGRVYFLRAQAYAKLGDIENAKKDLRSAVECDQKYKRQADILYRKILTGSRDFYDLSTED